MNKVERLESMLKKNEEFVAKGEGEKFKASKFSNKNMLVITCMDARLIKMLPEALDLKNGDANIIKTAGALVCGKSENVLRSILVSVYELGVEEIFVVGHYDCGMAGFCCDNLLEKWKDRSDVQQGVQQLSNEGVNFERWLKGFDHVEDSVKESVSFLHEYPLLPQGIKIHGLIIDPENGKVDHVTSLTKEERAERTV